MIIRNKTSSFDEFVKRGILANNQFNIKEIIDLESIKSIFFVQEEYSEIEKLIFQKDIEAIKSFNENQKRTGEYMDIMIFKDQAQSEYIVTVYDSNALEQDPQVIEIYRL